MKTYIITTRSTVYSVYEVEADTEQEAREIVDTQGGLESLNDWSEDTEIYAVETEEEN
jgi:hypothetical protein